MAKVQFSSDKYQAVIRLIQQGINNGVSNRDLRGHVMKQFKAGPDGNQGTLDDVAMTKNGLSTYIANVKDHFGLNDYNVGAKVLGTIVKSSPVMSVCKVDEYGVVTQVKYYTDDSYLDVDTKGLHMSKGYQIVGQRLGTVASTPLTLSEGQELVFE